MANKTLLDLIPVPFSASFLGVHTHTFSIIAFQLILLLLASLTSCTLHLPETPFLSLSGKLLFILGVTLLIHSLTRYLNAFYALGTTIRNWQIKHMQRMISCPHATYILGEESKVTAKNRIFKGCDDVFFKEIFLELRLPLLVSATVSMKLFLILTVNTLLVCLLWLLSLSA